MDHSLKMSEDFIPHNLNQILTMKHLGSTEVRMTQKHLLKSHTKWKWIYLKLIWHFTHSSEWISVV